MARVLLLFELDQLHLLDVRHRPGPPVARYREVATQGTDAPDALGLTINVGKDTSMDDRSLIVLVAALLLFLVIVGFIVAYLFQPIPVQ
jgi:hypothetical protein